MLKKILTVTAFTGALVGCLATPSDLEQDEARGEDSDDLGSLEQGLSSLTVSAKFTPSIAAPGEQVTFRWWSTRATLGCDVFGVPGASVSGTSGSHTFVANEDLSAVVWCEDLNGVRKGSASLTVDASVGQPPPPPECTIDTDCDDGVFCNGQERCVSSQCVAAGYPCGYKSCSEFLDTCELTCVNTSKGVFCP